MTVLHLSSRWPAGLSILLSAGAASVIDKVCPVSGFKYPITAVDLAMYFQCEEAVRILLDAGCRWDKLNVFNRDAILPACIGIIARGVADRRRRLARLAEGALTESQLEPMGLHAGLLDSHAATVTILLRDAGAHVPTDLSVPDDYEGIYLSGNLHIRDFPAFFDSGFIDPTHRDRRGLLPIQLVELDSYMRSKAGYTRKGLLAPGMIPWLKQHGFLEPSPTDPLGLGINTAATGWHMLALRLGHESPLRHRQRGVRSLSHLDAAYGLFRDVLGVRRADACRCAFSSSGCLPSTTFFKALARRRYYYWNQDTFALFYGLGHWDAFQGDLAPELLRYLTFEALEMTHTCCAGDELFGFGFRVLRPFGGSTEEIRDEDGGLLVRLEALLAEFEMRLREGGGAAG